MSTGHYDDFGRPRGVVIFAARTYTDYRMANGDTWTQHHPPDRRRREPLRNGRRGKFIAGRGRGR